MVIQNGERTVYAKRSIITGESEPGTEKFDSESVAILKQRKDFKPKAKDKFTIVVWIEGDDPECKNDLLGGEIKMHMDITEEHVDNNDSKKKKDKGVWVLWQKQKQKKIEKEEEKYF